MAAEVSTLREQAASRYGKAGGAPDLPWPLGVEGAAGASGGAATGGGESAGGMAVGQGPRHGTTTEGEAEALTVEAHSLKLAADLRLPAHRDELIYVFRRTGTAAEPATMPATTTPRP